MSHAASDPYLDPASGVLRNLLGITDAAELARAEAALSASRLIDLERRRLPGRLAAADRLRGLARDPFITALTGFLADDADDAGVFTHSSSCR